MTEPPADYLEWERFYGEEAAEGVASILDSMAAFDNGPDLLPHRTSLIACLRHARECYLMEYWDWLGRSTSEGSDWRPHRDERKNPGDTSPYDYGEFSAPPDAWQTHWDEFFAKPIAANGNRARNPGTFRGLENNGPPLGKPMLAGVYHRVNRWWRGALGIPFRPNFDGMASADHDLERLPHLSPAARFFVLFAQEVDPRFTMEHCARVNSEEARRQRTEK